MRYPAAKALILMVAGILGAYYLPIPAEIPLLFAGGSIIVAAVFLYLGKRKFLFVIAAILLVAVGYFRSQLFTEQRPPNHISNFTSFDNRVRFSGRIALDPDIRDHRTFLTIDTDTIYISQDIKMEVTGKVLIDITPATGRFQYGDIVSVFGYLNKPPRPGNPHLFDYRGYLARKGIFVYCPIKGDYNVKVVERAEIRNFISGVILPARNYLINVFSQLPTSGNGALLSGFMLGEKRGIPADIKEAFINSGTMHLLAVSGSNLALVSLIFFLSIRFVPVSKKWKLFGSIPFIIVFCYMTNNEPSVVRAAVMLLMGVLSFIMKRRMNPVNIICSAALVLLAVYPLWLFNIGFQLSFAAVIGIAFCLQSNLFTPARPRKYIARIRQFIIYTAFASVAAFLFTAPITAYNFNRVAIYSVFSNIPAAIIMLTVTTLGVASAIVYPIGGIISGVVLWMTDQVVTLMRVVTDFFSTLPYADLDIPSPDILTITLYYSLLAIPFTLKWKPGFSKYALIVFLVLSNFKVWGELKSINKDEYFVEFLDAGFSDVMLIYSNRDWNTLVYAGDDRTSSSIGERYIKPYLLKLGFGKIDNLILTENNSNSRRGLEDLLSTGFIKTIWVPSNCIANESIILAGYNGKIMEYFPGDTLISCNQIKYIIFNPDINLKEKPEYGSGLMIRSKILNSNLIFSGKSRIDLLNFLPGGVDILQTNDRYIDPMDESLKDMAAKIVCTGAPFLYWMEEGRTRDDIIPRLHRIRSEGAIKFCINKNGVSKLRIN